MDMYVRQLRIARAALFTVLVVALSVASHVLLSQAPLPLTTVVLTSGAVFAVAYALAGRKRGFGTVAGVLVPLELAADTVFTAGQHACYGAAGGPVTGPLRSVGFDLLCGGDIGTRLAPPIEAGNPVGTLIASPGPAAPWLLLAAHVSVGLLASAWLWRGESGLAAALDAAAARAFRPLLTAAAVLDAARRSVPLKVCVTGHRPHLLMLSRLLVHSLGRRGPPRSACATA
ncbi:hypothetical protein ABZW67_12080 [Streptomyces rubiginosohelvolus]|uniref:hypothetical protein n=1 Tax=Streptomyces rubiginosohelvolus TaxID=67362 RepID=UPI0033B47D49